MSLQLNYNLASFYCKRRSNRPNKLWRSFAEFDDVNPLPTSILTDLGIVNDLIDTMKKINELHQDRYQRMRSTPWRSIGPKTVVLIFAMLTLIVGMILVGSLVENAAIRIPVTLLLVGLAGSIIVYNIFQCRRYGCKGYVSSPTEKESRTEIMNGFNEKRK